ncbi:MAG: hypothetical protein ABIG84_02070 [archaeon]
MRPVKKGISPEKLAYLIFALVGAVIMLAIYLNYYNQPQGGIFCTVYGGVYKILPTGDEPPPLPRSCIQAPLVAPDSTNIYEKEKSVVEDRLVEYIVSCYQNNKDYSNLTMLCYHMQISSLIGEISEIDITNNMERTGYICDALENSVVIDAKGIARDYSSIEERTCGTKDQILWLVNENMIKKGDVVEIKYFDRKVKVIT